MTHSRSNLYLWYFAFEESCIFIFSRIIQKVRPFQNWKSLPCSPSQLCWSTLLYCPSDCSFPQHNCWHSELHPYDNRQAESIQKSNGKTIKMCSESKQWEEGDFKDAASVLGFSGQNERLISLLKSISLI